MVVTDEFMLASQRISRLTPLEVDLLFRMADLQGGQGRITMALLDNITPNQHGTMPYHIADQQKVTHNPVGPFKHPILSYSQLNNVPSISLFSRTSIVSDLGSSLVELGPLVCTQSTWSKLDYRINGPLGHMWAN